MNIQCVTSTISTVDSSSVNPSSVESDTAFVVSSSDTSLPVSASSDAFSVVSSSVAGSCVTSFSISIVVPSFTSCTSVMDVLVMVGKLSFSCSAEISLLISET